MSELIISVPATSANIGPGFDSSGLALKCYLTLRVTKATTWRIKHSSPNLPAVTNYEDHLIFQVAKRTAEKHQKALPPSHIDMKSDIPLTRGLGSSAAAVIAGIELANQLCQLSLTDEEKLQYGTKFENHSDNVAPALFGGLVITANTKGDEMNYIKFPALDFRVLLYIPTIELKTRDSRSVLPIMVTHEDAAKASGISNVMIASLLTKNYPLAGEMMEHDLFHEPYRAKLIPYYSEMKQHATKLGAYGTVISGAGPTMISFIPADKEEEIITGMRKVLPSDYEITSKLMDNTGLQVHYK